MIHLILWRDFPRISWKIASARKQRQHGPFLVTVQPKGPDIASDCAAWEFSHKYTSKKKKRLPLQISRPLCARAVKASFQSSLLCCFIRPMPVRSRASAFSGLRENTEKMNKLTCFILFPDDKWEKMKTGPYPTLDNITLQYIMALCVSRDKMPS